MKYSKFLFIATLISLAICWPSIDVSNSDDQRLELTFRDATADPSKAGRFDIKITSEWLFPQSFRNAGVICAVKDDTGDLVANTEYPGFGIEFHCSSSTGCPTTANPLALYSAHAIVNHTGSQVDYKQVGTGEMTPILDLSQTGSGTSADPYVMSGSFEYDEATKTSFNYPSSSQYLICYANPDLRVDTKLNQDHLDLGNVLVSFTFFA